MALQGGGLTHHPIPAPLKETGLERRENTLYNISAYRFFYLHLFWLLALVHKYILSSSCDKTCQGYALGQEVLCSGDCVLYILKAVACGPEDSHQDCGYVFILSAAHSVGHTKN